MPEILANEADDVSLLNRLRDGDQTAYTELWRKHVAAALRLGRRLTPEHAEDLASESFLAVYQQVAVLKAGPESSFRAYLFTTMRNTAIRWQNERNRVVSVAELELFEQLEDTDETSPLELLEKESTSAELLAAMNELPERWQRVLWLSEVQSASRSEIASDLGIRPNAVSALYRRARNGLRMNWLSLQIPPELREDTRHVAHLLPRLVVDGRAAGTMRTVKRHLAQCDTCDSLHSTLNADFSHMRKITLSLAGFLALGGTAPALAPLVGIGGGAVAAGVIGGTVAATGLGLLLAGSLAASVIVGVVPGGGVDPGRDTTTTAAPGSETEQQPPSPSPSEAAIKAVPQAETQPISSPISNLPSAPRLGLGNTDDTVEVVEFTRENPFVQPIAPRPEPPGTIPPPASEGPQENPAGLSVEMLSPATSTGYIAPTISGTSSPGSTVVVELLPYQPSNTTPSQYLASTAPSGEWAFNFQPLLPSQPGTYDYTVWAFNDNDQTTATPGQFVLAQPELFGFESLAPFEPIDPGAAQSTGIVFEVRGPSRGTICLSSVYAGQSALIPLDEAGSATQRIRFLSTGTYFFDFRACDGDLHGPAAEVFVDVHDPGELIWGPWGPDPSATEFLLEDL